VRSRQWKGPSRTGGRPGAGRARARCSHGALAERALCGDGQNRDKQSSAGSDDDIAKLGEGAWAGCGSAPRGPLTGAYRRKSSSRPKRKASVTGYGSTTQDPAANGVDSDGLGELRRPGVCSSKHGKAPQRSSGRGLPRSGKRGRDYLTASYPAPAPVARVAPGTTAPAARQSATPPAG
jgi:hypothetical protein